MRSYKAFVMLCVLEAGGCGAAKVAATDADPPVEIRLQMGQSTTVEDQALKITFQAVEGDSRCPKGETCVWEGDAVVRLAAKGATKADEELELHTSSKGPATVGYDGWSIRLVRLEPYPVTGRQISDTAYLVTLEVTRGPSAEVAIQ